MSSEPYRTAAFDYWEAGWRGILPIPANSKKLTIKGWTGHEGRTPSFADVYAWTEGFEGDGNIALRMPADVVGIDVDDYGTKSGRHTVEQFEALYGTLPTTWRSTARPAGRSGIYFFRVPTGLRWPGQLGPNVEIIQYAHRYAVVWPSFNPDAQAQYTWYPPDTYAIDSRTGEADRKIPHVDELPELPAAWVEALTAGLTLEIEHKAAISAGGVSKWIGEADYDGSCRQMAYAVAEAVSDFGHGSRHDVLNKGILRVVRLADGGHRALHKALIAIRDAFEYAASDPTRGSGRDDRALESEWNRSVEGAVALVIGSSERDPSSPRNPCECDDDPDDLIPGLYIGPLTTFIPEPVDPIGGPPAGAITAHLAAGNGDTWAPLDMDVYASDDGDQGERIETALGIRRDDGLRLLYAGLEHACIGETESGKSWFALACVAAELSVGHSVLYIHFEESNPRDTIQRLEMMDVKREAIRKFFHFVAPDERITSAARDHLLSLAPVLTVLDGQNEAMALHGMEINQPEGVTAYRRILVKPFTAIGSGVLSLDHVVKDKERNVMGYATGSAHKVNGLTGACFLLENRETFGRGLRGRSQIFVTKDRPGSLREMSEATKIPRKRLVGEMIVDSSRGCKSTGLYPNFAFEVNAPVAKDDPINELWPERDEDAETVYLAIEALSRENIAPTLRKVRATSGLKGTHTDSAIERLVIAGRIGEGKGERGARVFSPRGGKR